MKAATALLLLLVATLSWSSQVPERELRSALERVLADEGLAGIAWVLVDGAGEQSVGVAGLRDLPAGVPFEVDTRFHVGSVAKALLATGVLRLASEGRIDIDAPAEGYLPGLAFSNPWSGTSPVTVRHLLDHTSGLSDAHLWQLFSERPGPDTPLLDGFPDPSVQLRVRAIPGSRFSYSNMGYALLGMIVETVTGERYETYLDRHLLAPLGMRDSTFAFTTQVGEGADPRLAWGHVDDGTRYAAAATFLRPAGQFTTTVGDLGRFAAFLMSDGKVDGQRFIDEPLMRARGRPVGTEAARTGLVAGYALGLGRRDRHGVVGYCHGGNIVGFVAMLCVYPQEGKAFAFSVNTDSETANYGQLQRLLIDALDLQPAPEPPTARPADDLSPWYGRYILSPNRFAMFEYLDRLFGAVRISPTEGGLHLMPLLQDARPLRPVGDRLFSAGDRSTASHVLLRGEHGEFLVSDGFQTWEKVPGMYLFVHGTSLLLGLAGLLWLAIAGMAGLLRHRQAFISRPAAPALLFIGLLIVPVPFLAVQSFMALGDVTVGSVLLAGVTAALPLGMLWTIWRCWRNRGEVEGSRLNLIAALCALQWCVVLLVGGVLPFRLWA